jgi:hypothetical protein
MDLRRPVRVSHDYVQRLVAPPTSVFPLLCPVREREWVKGWEPGLVVSRSGVAERDCVFTTSTEHGEASWYVLEHEAEESTVEMLEIIPGQLATRLRIELQEAEGRDRITVPGHGEREVLGLARIRYTHTALSDAGEIEVRRWDAAHWREFMEEWQDQLNGYLVRHGAQLEP